MTLPVLAPLPPPLTTELFGATLRLTFPAPHGGSNVLTVTVGADRIRLLYARMRRDGALRGMTARSWPLDARPPLLADEFAVQVAAFVASGRGAPPGTGGLALGAPTSDSSTHIPS
ncbi:hypothetical protein ACFZAM_31940 [Streptomyces sp. NPDC008079]|uniref:hypothetical protein n=1 Tax=Streptomyces sp. NPDC008079 TaxID=3364806 RepID=UPI0036E76AC8